MAYEVSSIEGLEQQRKKYYYDRLIASGVSLPVDFATQDFETLYYRYVNAGVISPGPEVGPPVGLERSLAVWDEAYAKSDVSLAQAIVIGDSISEGSGANAVDRRWQTLLQGYLTRQKAIPSGAKYPFIPAKYQTPAALQPSTTEGNVVAGYPWGFGMRTVSIRDTTGKITFTFIGTSAKLLYVQNVALGIMRVVVDGGSPVLINTKGPAISTLAYDIGPLTPGEHTVVVTMDATSAATEYPYIQGLFTYNEDESRGVRIIDAAKHGIASTQYDATARTNLVRAMQATGTYHLAIIGLGTNDYTANNIPQFKTNYSSLMSTMRSNGFNGSFLLLHMYKGSGRFDSVWDAYAKAIAELAAEDPKAMFHDLRWDMPDVPANPATDISGLGYYFDSLHPNDSGHKKIAGVLANILAPNG